jgi:hypothetical protein
VSWRGVAQSWLVRRSVPPLAHLRARETPGWIPGFPADQTPKAVMKGRGIDDDRGGPGRETLLIKSVVGWPTPDRRQRRDDIWVDVREQAGSFLGGQAARGSGAEYGLLDIGGHR